MDIVRLVESGRMTLPQFQREFVWDPNKVVELLDSIAHGWPIGSLLLLEGPQAFETKDFQDGPPTSRESAEYYVLDGQQRITSIYHALTDQSDVVYLVDLTAQPNEGKPRFRWVKRNKFKPDSSNSIFPLAALVHEPQFRSLIAEIPSSQASKLRKARRSQLGALADGQYTVSATIMAKNIELEALARIFETINRTGVRLDAFDLMVSVLYPKNFHLRDRWNQAITDYPILDRLSTGGLEVLKLMALWRRDIDKNTKSQRRVTGVRQRDILNLPGEFVIDNWDSALRAYVSALELSLREFGVSDGNSKPSDAMILVLAYQISASGTSEPNLSRWYWQAIADQRYAQGANTQILTDLNFWPALTDSRESLSDLLSGSLNDPAKRNRILRLGIQGLTVKHGARDPVTREPLEGRLEELPITDLQPGLQTASNPEPLTVDNVLLNHGSTQGVLKHGLELDSESLQSQGFPGAIDGYDIANIRSKRVDTLIKWFRELT